MSEMKVTLIANASQPVSEIGKLQASANETAKSFAQVTKAAVDGSKAATGSFQDLKARLAGARAELDKLSEGTPEFLEQAATVRALNSEFMTARQKIAELTAAEQGLATGTATLKGNQQAAVAAAGSYQQMKERLTEAEAALSRMAVGTDEFKQQADIVGKLSVEVDSAKKEMQSLVAASSGLESGTATLNAQSKAATAATGSFAALERELKQNVDQLKAMKSGTAEFAQQKQKVDQLRASLEQVKDATKEGVESQSGIGGIVDDFTSSLSGTVSTLVGVGAIASSLKADLENIRRMNENKRLSEVDFGKALAARSISNLPQEERAVVRPLALNVAEQIGANPGAVVEALGELRSTGAQSLVEAAEFLTEAANAFPQDLAAASGIARAALIEAGATGNRNAKEVIGGTVAAQSASLTKSPEEFAKAFGSNIASAVSVYKVKPELAREEAAIFSLLETRGSDVAADAQRSFYTQISKFIPETSGKLKSGEKSTLSAEVVKAFKDASFTDRQTMLESNTDLRKQFFDSLQETGRTSIMRRLQPTAEDAVAIATVRQSVKGDAESADALTKLQETAQVSGTFAIAEGRRLAGEQTANLRADSRAKLEAELEATMDNIQERTRAFIGGSAQSGFERFGARVEQFMGGSDRAQVLLDTIRMRAATESDPANRTYLQNAEKNILELQQGIKALDSTNNEGNRLLAEMLQVLKANQQAPAPQVNQAPAPLGWKPRVAVPAAAAAAAVTSRSR